MYSRHPMEKERTETSHLLQMKWRANGKWHGLQLPCTSAPRSNSNGGHRTLPQHLNSLGSLTGLYKRWSFTFEESTNICTNIYIFLFHSLEQLWYLWNKRKKNAWKMKPTTEKLDKYPWRWYVLKGNRSDITAPRSRHLLHLPGLFLNYHIKKTKSWQHFKVSLMLCCPAR